MNFGCLRRTVSCPACDDEMKLVLTDKKKVFRCRHKSCGKRELSCRIGSLFYGSMLSCRTIMKIARAWIQEESRDAAVRSEKVDKETVTLWYSYFRDAVNCAIRSCEDKIGGPGIITEIDEIKMGKRKYNRGRRVEGVWGCAALKELLSGAFFVFRF